MNYITILDGTAADREWGAYPAEGTLVALLTLPEAAEIITNDWHERNGEEVSPAPVPTAIREVTLPFAVSESKAAALLDYFKSSPLHTLALPGLSPSAVWTIALRDEGEAEYFPQTRLLAPVFAVFRDPSEPKGAEEADDGAEFFRKLHSLGFQELEGTRAEMEKGSEVKECLPDQKAPLTLRSHDITIPLFYGGADLLTARRDLLRYFLQPGERTMTYEGRTIKALYRHSHTAQVLKRPDGRWWWELSITLKATTF